MTDFITVEDEDVDMSTSLVRSILPENSSDFLFDTSYRCDKGNCGAQAYVRTTFKSNDILFWCLHHAREVEERITPFLSEWYSEETRLIENRHKGSEN